MKLEFSRQIVEKSSNIKFNQNLSNGNRVVPRGLRDRQTDRRDEANSRFSVRPQRWPLSTTTHHILQYSFIMAAVWFASPTPLLFPLCLTVHAPDNFVPATVAPNYFPQRSRLSPSVHVPSQSLFISFFPFSHPILSFHSTLLQQPKYFIHSRDYFLPDPDWDVPSQIQQLQKIYGTKLCRPETIHIKVEYILLYYVLPFLSTIKSCFNT